MDRGNGARQRHGRGPLGGGHPDVARHEERAAVPARRRRGGEAHGQGLGGSAAGSRLAAGGWVGMRIVVLIVMLIVVNSGIK